GSSEGNERTSVALSFFLNLRLSARTRASDTMATVIAPRARAGAIDESHAASPGARPTTSTEKLPILRECVVRLHDLLHELVPDDVLLVEVDEPDAGDVTNHLERLHHSRHTGGG